MKLFISWSGEFSQKVAERLSVWIPTIIQSADVFYSNDDIAKGENWSNRLSKELDSCSFGIICLTPENVSAPWIHFEAGALSKSLNSRVSAIMLNINPSDIKGPLAYYQNTTFEREDFFRLFQSINESSDTPLKPEILRNSFDNAWENFKADIGRIIKLYASQAQNAPQKDPGPSDSDAIQEILRLVRKMDGSQIDDALPPVQIDSPSFSPIYVQINVNEQTDLKEVFEVISRYSPKLTDKEKAKFLQELRRFHRSRISIDRRVDFTRLADDLHYLGALITVLG